MAGAALFGRRVMWRIGTVVALRDETPTARTITLDVPAWPGHIAGQHVDVRVTAPDGYSAVRSYSIASSPNSHGRVEITVERLPNGEVSPYLTQEVAAGDRLELRGPIGGWFVWRAEQTESVQLIAGGFRRRSAHGHDSLARWSTQHCPLSIAVFRALNRKSLSTATSSRRYPIKDHSLGITYAYTRVAPSDWPRPPARIDASLIASATWPSNLAPTCYVCGPTSFVESATDLLSASGNDRDKIRTERFGSTERTKNDLV